MSQEQHVATHRTVRRFAIRPARGWLGLGSVLVATGVVVTLGVSRTQATAESDGHQVSGAGRTIIEGGTGGSAPQPVITTVAFHADRHGGDFECLALVPANATGNGSGEFSVNAMYVTGTVTSLDVHGHTAVLRGTATVTGLGAGQARPFTASVVAGGSGTRVTLQVSGLTFREIVLEGNIDVT
jgi:hypothetical protein